MKNVKYGLIFTLVMFMSVFMTIPANAASKKADTIEKVEMKTNEITSINIKLKSKAAWTSSNPKIVAVKANGKYNQRATFSTGNKTGSCVVKAKTKNKVYKYKVTVKKGTIIKPYKGSASKAVFDKMTKNYTVTVKFCNASKKERWYGHGFSLQRYENGKWTTVLMNADYAFNAMAISVPAKTSVKAASGNDGCKGTVQRNLPDPNELSCGTQKLLCKI